MAQEADRATLALMVLRPMPGMNQARMNKLLDAAIEGGLRWTDLNDYLDRDAMGEMAKLLDTYAAARGLPKLTGEQA